MNQTRLAERLGTDRANITNWKTRGMPAEWHKAGADAVGRTVDELLGGVGATKTHDSSGLEPAGHARPPRPVPVVGTARLGTNGYYEELQYPAGHGDGWVDSYSTDAAAYALRVKGDSMHPAIRHGAFIVAEPSRPCVPGEYVVLALTGGQKMVKELVIERSDEVVVESVNGGDRLTIERANIEKMHPVAAVVAPSKWRPG